MAERFIICDEPNVFEDIVTGVCYELACVTEPKDSKMRVVDPDSLVEFLVDQLNSNRHKFQ